MEHSSGESGVSDGESVGRGEEAGSGANGRGGASEDDEEGADGRSGREDEAFQHAYVENRRIYNRTKGWPKTDVPPIALTDFQELRRRHLERLVEQEADRYEVKGTTHYTRMLDQLQHREEREATLVHPIQECLENQYKRVQRLYEPGGKHAYNDDQRNWHAARRRDLMRYEGAACLTADKTDREALAPEDELGNILITFIEQLPADRRKLVYVADSFQKPPSFSTPRILRSNDHTLDRSEEMWVNFNDRVWMMTNELGGVRPTELYEPGRRGAVSQVTVDYEPDRGTLTMDIRSQWSVMDLRLQIEHLKGVPHHEQEIVVEWGDS